MNKKLHEGPASFSSKSKTLAYTKNNYNDVSKDGFSTLQIFFKSYENGKWSDEKSFSYNSSEYSVAHPYLSENGNVLYFSSNMPGGFGGSDLYKVEKDNYGNWSAISNLGNKINTEGDEYYPFYDEKGEILYFSSNGHLGLGGLDVFATKLSSPKVINIGTPVNSQYDDFAFVLKSDGKLGYFSSDRINGKGGDDIYAIQVLKPLLFNKTVKGEVKLASGELASDVTINLFDSKNTLIKSIKNRQKWSVSFRVRRKGIQNSF